MKKVKLILSLIAVFVFAGNSLGQISGTAHNLAGDISDANMPGSFAGEICAACHIPHNGVNAAGTVLWSQTLAAAGAFTMYTSGTMPTGGDLSVTSESLKCLGCHDDATSIHGAGTLSAIFPATTAAVGVDLTNDHPIGVILDPAQPDLQSPTNARTFLNGGNEYVECGSCHNAHESTLPMFLRTTNDGSALCLDCHIK